MGWGVGHCAALPQLVSRALKPCAPIPRFITKRAFVHSRRCASTEFMILLASDTRPEAAAGLPRL
jgi:hypothetical protein